MSNKLAIAISDHLSSSSGFSRILYQKAWEIAQLGLEVNHPNAILLQSDRRCNWLNYYGFNLNNLLKLGL
ncbi:hypothetical protein [Nostoc sp.]|uniref:hypothetical protein n=1 Tax=Nostoc sp. TaxID=1180 RepID=UPI002FF55F2E